MKILFVGDYSNLHACLAAELRRRGHDVTVVSDGGTFMRTAVDVPVVRKPGKIGGIRYIWQIMAAIPRMKDYDVVQLINPNFFFMKPGRLKPIFEYLKANNRSIWLTLCSDDWYFADACCRGELFRFSEYRVGKEPTRFISDVNPGFETGWLCRDNHDLHEHIYAQIDGGMSVLPEYDMAARPILGDRLTFTNLPIDLSRLEYREPRSEGPLNYFTGIKASFYDRKGLPKLLEIGDALEREYPELVRTSEARNLPLEEYLRRMDDADIVADQLYSYSPATNALQAMAKGKVAVSGGTPEYYAFIGEDPGDVPPLIAADPTRIDEIGRQILEVARDRERLRTMTRKARQLVERHNDVRIVADRFLERWRLKVES